MTSRPRLLFQHVSIMVLLTMMLTLQSCFTGVESTPKITSKDIKRRGVTESAEKNILANITPQAPANWTPGKQFFILDTKVSMIFENFTGDSLTTLIPYHKITFRGVTPRRSITGQEITIVSFITDDKHLLTYNSGIEYQHLSSLKTLDIPFAIETDIIDSVAQRLVGNTYYIIPARRLSTTGTDTVGQRYTPVTITAVSPGTASYPLKVLFTDNSGNNSAILMTIGERASSTRNFDRIFSISDPRKSYPLINDETWQLIINSRLKDGMTTQECRLAIGPPNDIQRVPSTAGMIERWTYDDGIYLIFEDGILARYRY